MYKILLARINKCYIVHICSKVILFLKEEQNTMLEYSRLGSWHLSVLWKGEWGREHQKSQKLILGFNFTNIIAS